MTILYVHGMGGGSDSRIPGRLRELIPECNVVCNTYDFRPDIAHEQVTEWLRETKADLVIGESLGSIHALSLDGVPQILISPAINAPWYLSLISPLTLIPGVGDGLRRRFEPKPGERQALTFNYDRLHGWLRFRRIARRTSLKSSQPHFAFIGTMDHYRKSGIVSVRTWTKWFGPDSYQLYEGSHFMEEEFLIQYLVPKIRSIIS